MHRSTIVTPLLLLSLLSSLLLTGCVTLPGMQSAGATVPTHAFASNRASNFGHVLSPDGNRLAWVGVSGARLVVYVRDLHSGRTHTINARGLLSFRWSADSRHLLSNSPTAAGTEDHVLVAVDPEDGAFRWLAGAKGAPARLVGVELDAPGSLIVELGKRDPAFPDLFSLDTRTRALTPLEVNNGHTVSWMTTPAGTLAGRIIRERGGKALEIRQEDGSYRRVHAWDTRDKVSIASISHDRARSYLLSNQGAERVRLLELDNTTGALRVVHEEAEVDVAAVHLDPVSGAPLLVAGEPDYPRSTVLDDRLADMLKRVTPAGQPARVMIESADRHLARIVVAVATDRGSSVYLMDLRQGRSELLGAPATAPFQAELAPMRPVRLSARDGTPLYGYLTMPPRAAGTLPPLVLQVHGGPRDRTVWGYDAMTQFLANRGYAVLDINFRGSVGYGRTFQEKGHGEWGRAMQSDLYDAVAWAVAQGHVDPARVAVIGVSYGGYAAVTALLDEPRVFSCGIAINAPLDLADTFARMPRQWAHDLPAVLPYLGVESVHDPALAARSPSHRAASLSRPLLLVQGGLDGRVNPAQAARFAALAERAGAPLTYWPVAGESHGFTNWKSRLRLFRKSEHMLAACLGGRDAGFDYYELGYKLF
jgi:dipeptidyl aminopeptidase/acylaminoacyl peptidase